VTTHVDPLERLVVDQAAADRELLASLLTGRIAVDRASARYSFVPGIRPQLGTRRTVLIALLARKALSLLVEGFVEPATPRELEAESGIRGGTLRPILKDLKDENLLLKTGDGYLVANHALEFAAAEFSNND
jgi:hypothetical protein